MELGQGMTHGHPLALQHGGEGGRQEPRRGDHGHVGTWWARPGLLWPLGLGLSEGSGWGGGQFLPGLWAQGKGTSLGLEPCDPCPFSSTTVRPVGCGTGQG